MLVNVDKVYSYIQGSNLEKNHSADVYTQQMCMSTKE